MSKFKIGDRVYTIGSYTFSDYKSIDAGDLGTVVEDDSTCPYVRWDRLKETWAIDEDELDFARVGKKQTTGLTPFQLEAGKNYYSLHIDHVGMRFRVKDGNLECKWRKKFVKVNLSDMALYYKGFAEVVYEAHSIPSMPSHQLQRQHNGDIKIGCQTLKAEDIPGVVAYLQEGV